MDDIATSPKPNFTGLSFRDLEYVVAVSDLGSFVAAARHCHVAQPSLSVQVRRIEERLHTPIFERTARGVVTTSAGRAIVEQMRRALAEGRALLALARRPDRAFNGTLRLSAIPTLAPYYFPRLLEPVRDTFPDLELQLGEGGGDDLCAKLMAGDIDAVIMSAPVIHRALDHCPLGGESLLMACPATHPAARANGPDWHELDDASRLLLAEPDCLRNQAIHAAGAPGSAKASPTLDALLYRVASGEGCALVPAFAERLVPGVVYRRSMRVERQRELVIAWRTNTAHRADMHRLAERIATIRP
ncbi:MAG: Hydrogen peroxide-inducible genes activator [Luteibacter sp.]|uniref:LysR substrate-binding domain-containing protein n=1 Tax=Luteibacter sp. TaxID=1886636 RepID=UPI0013823E68|nr:LysR substrate-binding domain-containing protein [Luteibacter sp.]KAF1008646.1 MAG: Hydrogen peroxide-inducible genes activator [Luteibacter sp.]